MSFDSHKLESCARLSMEAWLFAHLIISCFHFPSNVFSCVLWTRLGLPHPLVLGLTHCICGHSLNPMGIHLLHCTHGGERIASYNAIQDAFVSIVRDAGFHILHKQTHILWPPSFQFFYRWVNIVCQLISFTLWPMLSLSTLFE
jgi:hypothetical protein